LFDSSDVMVAWPVAVSACNTAGPTRRPGRALRTYVEAAHTSALDENQPEGDNMRLLLVALGCAFCATVAAAVTPDAALRAPIHQFIDSFNNGDAATAAATHVSDDLTIIDEVAPFIWKGHDAFKSWSDDLAADATKNGISDQWVTLGDTVRQESASGRAYVIVQAVYTYKLKGAPMREDAQMTFALRNTDAGWRIAGWTWTGRPPQPAQ
jgi:SnoaL-like domain